MTTSNVENTTVETAEKVQAPFYQIKSIRREFKEELNENISLIEKIENGTASDNEIIEIANIVIKNIEVVNSKGTGRKSSLEAAQNNIEKEHNRIQKKIEKIEQKQAEYDSLKNKNSKKAIKLLANIKKLKHDIVVIQEGIENLQVKIYNIVSPDSQAA